MSRAKKVWEVRPVGSREVLLDLELDLEELGPIILESGSIFRLEPLAFTKERNTSGDWVWRGQVRLVPDRGTMEELFPYLEEKTLVVKDPEEVLADPEAFAILRESFDGERRVEKALEDGKPLHELEEEMDQELPVNWAEELILWGFILAGVAAVVLAGILAFIS